MIYTQRNTKIFSFSVYTVLFYEQFNFGFQVNKEMTDEQLFHVIETIDDYITMYGIGENDWENDIGRIGSNILSKMANEDKD